MQSIPSYSAEPPITIEAFRNRACSLAFSDPDYVPPTATDVKTLRNLMGLSQKELAKFLGVNYTENKGSPTVRKWETDESKPSHRAISYAAWRLMLLASGVIDLFTLQTELQEHGVKNDAFEEGVLLKQ